MTGFQQETDDWPNIAVKLSAKNSIGPYRVRIGRTNSRLYAAEEFRPVLVLGPQRSYKTSGFAVPAVLEWEGPVVTTSVRHDILEDTFKWRKRIGKISIFDPSNSLKDTIYAEYCYNWDLLSHCRTWDNSVRMGKALTEAGRSGGPGGAGSGLQDGDFWYSMAGKLIVPHLFAASANGYTMNDVVRWIKTQEQFEVRSLLQATGHEGAIMSAEASWQREDRARSSIYTTAEQILQVFDYEDNRIFSEPFLDLKGFFKSTADTIYIVAPPDEQEEYKPLFTGLVRTIIREVYRRNSQVKDEQENIRLDIGGGEPDCPGQNKIVPLLLMLDEAGNIAPLATLDTLATTAAGTKVQIVSIFHDISQIESVYNAHMAKSIISNHSAFIVLPGARDIATLDYVESLLRGERVANSVENRWTGPRPIRSMNRGEALLIYENRRPIVLWLRSKFNDDLLSGRVNGQDVC